MPKKKDTSEEIVKKSPKIKKKVVEKTTGSQVNKSVGKKSANSGAGVEGKNTKISKPKYSLLRGMHDILPREEKYQAPFLKIANDLAKHFRFKKIQTPVLEEANLFIRSIGRGTDVVDKEMYTFEDRDKKKVCLRPEMTASVARAYMIHGLWNMTQPLKLWYWGPMFRHDRPQAGRYREFNQVGFEILGKADPVIDAELILLAYNFYNDLGMPVEVHINSIGTPEERERYKMALVEYYRSKRSYLCEDCRKRINKNPMRLLDCKQKQCQPIKEESPQIIEWLDSESKSHFVKVLEYMDELGIPYVLRHSLVRGLDYYTRTVFEIYPAIIEETEGSDTESSLSKQEALGGGGRYDLLVEQMGGRPTPACGFSLGIERSVSFLRKCCEKEICKLEKQEFDVFVAQLGDQARRRALKIIDEFRKSGIRVDFNLSKKSLKDQLDMANSIQVPFALILGQKEVQDNTVIIRDMESGVQEIVDQKKVMGVLLKKIGKV
ncbi:MAG: histidine--tRNA ligase [bacterium]